MGAKAGNSRACSAVSARCRACPICSPATLSAPASRMPGRQWRPPAPSVPARAGPANSGRRAVPASGKTVLAAAAPSSGGRAPGLGGAGEKFGRKSAWGSAFPGQAPPNSPSRVRTWPHNWKSRAGSRPSRRSRCRSRVVRQSFAAWLPRTTTVGWRSGWPGCSRGSAKSRIS